MVSGGEFGDASIDLTYERSRLLSGSVGGQPVRLELNVPTYHGRAAGTIAGLPVSATWVNGDNYRIYPDVPSDLTGSFAGRPVELHATFHLEPGYFFDQGTITGHVGADDLHATVEAVAPPPGAAPGLSLPTERWATPSSRSTPPSTSRLPPGSSVERWLAPPSASMRRAPMAQTANSTDGETSARTRRPLRHIPGHQDLHPPPGQPVIPRHGALRMAFQHHRRDPTRAIDIAHHPAHQDANDVARHPRTMS